MLVWALLGMLIGLMVAGGSGAFLGLGLGYVFHRVLMQVLKGGGSGAELAALRERVDLLEQQVAVLKARQPESAPESSFGPVPMTIEPMAAPPSAPAQAVWEAYDTVPMPEPADLPARVSASLGESVAAAAEVPADAPADAPAPLWPQHQAEPVRPAKPFKDRLPTWLQNWIWGGNTIVKVGVLVLFLGLAFLLRYVAEQFTAPIEWRYASVAALGVALLVVGWRLRGRNDASGQPGYGLILQGAGVGVFYLTTLAAMKLHPLLPVPAGFAIMVAVTALGACLAVAQDAAWLAMVASAAGFATPVLVSTGAGNHLALFSYIAILDLGILAMAWFKAWRALNLIGFVGTFTLGAAWADAQYRPEFYVSTQAFLVFFFLLFTAVGVLFARRALALTTDPSEGPAHDTLATRAVQALRDVGRVDSSLVFGVPLAAFSLQYLLVLDWPKGPAWSAFGMGLFEVALGAWIWRGGRPRYALLGEAYVVVGVLLGTLAIPLALDGVWTGASWAVEAAGMYWLGTRQHRPYTRLFALALMGFAALRTLSTLTWAAGGLDAPWLAGAWMGPALLAAGALALAWVKHQAARAEPEPALPSITQALESTGAQACWALASFALATLPCLWWAPLWASVAMGILAAVCAMLGGRLRVPVLQVCSLVIHALALVGFVSALRPAEAGPLWLANGLQGGVAACLHALALLLTAGIGMRDAWQAMQENASDPDANWHPPVWPVQGSALVFVGLGLVAVALLFVLPVMQAALLWPILGLLFWLPGLRLAHPALMAMWPTLTAAATLVFAAEGSPLWQVGTPAAGGVPPVGLMGDLSWWMPWVLSVTGLWVADALQMRIRHRASWVDHRLQTPWVAAGLIAWGLFWWSQAVLPEVWRRLAEVHQEADWAALVVVWITLTSAGMLALAHRRQWVEMTRAVALTPAAWLCTVLLGPCMASWPPLAHLGWLAWPMALAWHLVLLRQLPASLSGRVMQALHVIGWWLLACLGTLQLHRMVVPWAQSAPGTGLPAIGDGWVALSWVLVPAVMLLVLSRPAIAERWPWREALPAYRGVGSLPLVVGVALWWADSIGLAGQAKPLPYLPLLNPLELAQGLALLSLWVWSPTVMPGAQGLAQGLLPQREGASPPWLMLALGAVAWLMLTTVVLRTCHHWGGVPWQADALFHARLAQAALSVSWAVMGVGLMLAGHRQSHRWVWAAGAGLLGVVVLKLFFIELADHGGLYRIVSFIVVGLLLLVVGYFAPVPPAVSQGPDPEGQAPGPEQATP